MADCMRQIRGWLGAGIYCLAVGFGREFEDSELTVPSGILCVLLVYW